ncbi:MAG: GIY-YIG nuclease family protein [Proteobacteria bacterium]|nr:GIY-YIG nuclease family protein [Pseudomonadota bacterium]
MLECGDASLYTGITNDLERRLTAHREGRAARYTRSHLPVRLVWREGHPTRAAALRREAAIKKLPRREKQRLVRDRGGESSPSHRDGVPTAGG